MDKKPKDKKEKVDPTELSPTTMRKSMRSLEELIAEFATEGPANLSEDEERLVDRITFEQKGERFGRFAEEREEEDLGIPVLTKDTSMKAVREKIKASEARKLAPREELPTVPPIVHGQVFSPSRNVS